jgi:transcriptional enhancer factor
MFFLLNNKLISYLFSFFQQFWQPGLQPSTSQDVKPFAQTASYLTGKSSTTVSAVEPQHPWEGRAIATHKFRLVEFSAYLELRVEETVSPNE